MTGPRTLGALMACPRSTAMWRAVRRAWDRMRARQRRHEREREAAEMGYLVEGGEG